MSKIAGSEPIVSEDCYNLLVTKHPNTEVYEMTAEDGRHWYLTRFSERQYAYVFVRDHPVIVRSDCTDGLWSSMLLTSKLVVDSGAMPYAHRS